MNPKNLTKLTIAIEQALTMKWIIREKVKVDRVACPWLITKFVDKQAEFVFVRANNVVEEAQVSALYHSMLQAWSWIITVRSVPSRQS
jgi:hypothetical protein